MMRFMSKLREMGIKLYFVMPTFTGKPSKVQHNSGQNEYEKAMAANLLKLPTPLAYYCGNVHAAKSLIYGIKPCGSLLPRSKTLSFRITASNGSTFYNLRIKKIPADKILKKTVKRTPALIESDDPNYDFKYVIGRFTPSR